MPRRHGIAAGGPGSLAAAVGANNQSPDGRDTLAEAEADDFDSEPGGCQVPHRASRSPALIATPSRPRPPLLTDSVTVTNVVTSTDTVIARRRSRRGNPAPSSRCFSVVGRKLPRIKMGEALINRDPHSGRAVRRVKAYRPQLTMTDLHLLEMWQQVSRRSSDSEE
jgi:hypothetical protein